MIVGDQLVQSDGTISGTSIVQEALTFGFVFDSSHVPHFLVGQNEQSSLHQIGSDGTITQEMPIPGLATQLGGFGGSFFFFSAVENPDGSVDRSLFLTDGTEAGTSVVADGSTWAYQLNDVLLFRSGDALMRTDGTAEGTYVVGPFQPGQFVAGEIGGYAYFQISLIGGMTLNTWLDSYTDGDQLFNIETGDVIEMPQTDDLSPGVSLEPPPWASWYEFDGYFKEGYTPGFGRPFSYSYHLPDERGVLVKTGPSGSDVDAFGVNDSTYLMSPNWLYVDGTTVNAGTRTDDFQDAFHLAGVQPNEALYFVLGPEQDPMLWRLGEEQDLAPIGPIETWSTDEQNGLYFFTRETPELGHELWATLGSMETTVPVDIAAGPTSSNPKLPPIANADLWTGLRIVIAETPETGFELWAVDGEIENEQPISLEAALPPVDVETDATDVTFALAMVNPTAEMTFSWDLNNDGQFADASGQNFSLSIDELLTIQPAIVRNAYTPYHVRIENAVGDVHVETSLLRINDPSPIVHALNAVPEATLIGEVFQLEIDASDNGEELRYSVDFGDGTVIEQTSSVFAHSYSRMGQYTITANAIDEHSTRGMGWHQITVSHPAGATEAWRFEPGKVFGSSSLGFDIVDPDHDNVFDRIYSVSTDGRVEVFGPDIAAGGPYYGDDFVPFSVPDANGVSVIYRSPIIEHDALVVTSANGLIGVHADPWVQISNEVESRDVVSAYLDDDPWRDIVIANYTDAEGNPAGDVVLRAKSGENNSGQPNGRNFEVVQRLGAYRSTVVQAGDFDQDGLNDLVTAGPDGIHLWINAGVEFHEGQSIDVDVNFLQTADLDGDGDLDFVVARNGANRAFLNDGTGNFSITDQSLGEAQSNHLALGDLDLDGDTDVMFANGLGEANTVWLNDGSGQFVDSGTRLAPELDSIQVELRRVNSDPRVDAIVAASNGPSHVYINNAVKMVRTQTKVEDGTLHSLEIEFDRPVEVTRISAGFGSNLISRQETTFSSKFTLIPTRPNIQVGTLNWTIEFNEGEYDSGGGRRQVQYFELLVTHDGDVDGDLDVDYDDLAVLTANFGRSTDVELSDGDIDQDGTVSFADFLLLSRNFGKTG